MKDNTDNAIFAAGCFWHPEETFSKTKGVISTRVGYIGGKMKNPTYYAVCGGSTGHVEATEVTFDPKITSYKDLLEIFWKIHDPTSRDRQGLDFGKQYNAAIFYMNEKQRKEAMESLKEEKKKTKAKIVTKIRKAPKFWPAEEYHQKYMEKHKLGSFGL